MKKATFYHAGCPVCVSAEHDVLNLVDKNQYNVEIVHLWTDKNRVADAEKAGVKSVPALVTDSGNVLHINFGASLEDLKNWRIFFLFLFVRNANFMAGMQ